MGQTTWKDSTEMFIDNRVAQYHRLLRRVGSHVCQPSLLTILIVPYSLPKISTDKNPYTNTRDAELDPFADVMWCCVWGTVFMMLADTLILVIKCLSDKCIIGKIVDLTLLTDQIYPFTVFLPIQVSS